MNPKLVPLKERLGLEDGMKLLDVGCDDGNHISSLKANLSLRVGIDIGKAGLLHKRTNVKFVLGDACYLPFVDKCFDIVMSRQFISHVWDVDKSFQEMQRVCSELIYTEDSNMFNPVVFAELFFRYGFKWLFGKQNFNRLSKLEDIHSAFWWKRKFRKQVTFLSRRFENPLLNVLWKYFGRDCIFTIRVKR